MDIWLFGGRTPCDAPTSLSSFQIRRVLLRSLAPRSQQASPVQKTLLLDAFVEWKGESCKEAIELLNHEKLAAQENAEKNGVCWGHPCLEVLVAKANGWRRLFLSLTKPRGPRQYSRLGKNLFGRAPVSGRGGGSADRNARRASLAAKRKARMSMGFTS